MGEEKEILLRGNFCAYLTGRLMGDPIHSLFTLLFTLFTTPFFLVAHDN